MRSGGRVGRDILVMMMISKSDGRMRSLEWCLVLATIACDMAPGVMLSWWGVSAVTIE